MKTSLIKSALFGAILLAFAPASSMFAQKPGWSDNQAKALEKAKADKKLVLMDFTGSDWCGWCMKMDKEVFSTAEFKEYAAKNLELVELDFPRQKYMNPATKKQNDELAKKYNVDGFPTMIVTDSDGKAIKVFGGYQEGGAKAFIEQLEKLKS